MVESLDVRSMFTADLHLTTRPQDEYRWEIFPWLLTQVKSRSIDSLFILGDITDRKDHHPAQLVNRLVDHLVALTKITEVIILKGNHDYSEADWPYFKFLRNMRHVTYFSHPGVFDLGYSYCCLPHSDFWKAEWKGVRKEEYDFVLIHQAVAGAKGSAGFEMEGVPASIFKSCGVVLAGDIHVPQQIGRVIYCGAPHPVDFGDEWTPRVLYWDGQQLKSIKRITLKKATLRIDTPEALQGVAAAKELVPGDQVKVILQLTRSELTDWPKMKAKTLDIVKSMELVLRALELEVISPQPRLKEGEVVKNKPGLSPLDTLKGFCKQQKVVPDLEEIGIQLLNKR